MSNVLEQARLLGQAIEQSEVNRTMCVAEEAVMEDEQASRLMQEYGQLKAQVQEMLESQNPDEDLLEQRSDALQEMQERLSALPLVQKMMESRAAFSQMMNEVNQVIQFTITGEVSDCGGDCGGCGGGCGHAH